MAVIEELRESADPASLYERLATGRGSVLLESGPGDFRGGRYSLIASEPYAELLAKDGRTFWNGTELREDALSVLEKELAHRREEPVPGIPWLGGAVGYLSYDLGRRFERIPRLLPDELALPDLHLAFFDRGVVVDHETGRVFAVASGTQPGEGLRRLGELLRRSVAEVSGKAAGPLESNLDRQAYEEMVRQALEYIRAGEIFQVNLSQRFQLPVRGDPWAHYRALRRRNPSPFAAFLDFAEGAVLSASPESFLRWRDGTVETRPIKGTRPRTGNDTLDQAARKELQESPKDRAELIMIVDLLRNDLGRVADFGTVRVRELAALEEHPTVFHLVGTITARPRAGIGVSDLIRATFPGGSITGAPKIRAMSIIEELETVRRGVYTGSIGHFSFSGEMELNIAIRSIFLREGRAYFHAGGGIVADSDPAQEYEESLAKARALWEALGSEGPR